MPTKGRQSHEKEGREDMDHKFDVEEEILIVKRNDKNIVNVGTSHQTVEPFANAKRWSTYLKQAVAIPQPQLIARYNKFMGGVNHLDWLIQKC